MRTAMAAPPPPSHAPGMVQVAEIHFAPNSTVLAPAERQQLQQVLNLHRMNGGSVLIIGYGDGGKSTKAEIDGFGIALDRAQTVAAALTDGGLDSHAITVETAPVSVAGGKSESHGTAVYLHY
jgi:outer membrane protein OmpA-like peptidoglycan-associated protein